MEVEIREERRCCFVVCDERGRGYGLRSVGVFRGWKRGGVDFFWSF